uniref:Cytochromes P450 345A1 n=1 Tax=Holotrichia parallela TaxID=93412 RepID=A0A6M3GU96_HOLPA|nr:cytochromes P450 345A1 [Holotrichia parallela]
MYTSGIFIFISLFFLIYLLYLILRKDRGYYWRIRRVKFENPLFLVGNVIDAILLRKSLAILVKDLYFKFSSERFFGMWILTVPNLVLRSPDLIKSILVKDFEYFYDRNVTCNEDVDPLSANMMFFMMNPKWKFIRAKTTPLFSSGKMKFIYSKIQIIAKDMALYMGFNNNTLTAQDIAAKFSTEVICSSAFGIDAHSFQDKETPFTKVGKDTFGLTLRNAFAAATYFCKSPLVEICKIKFVPSSTAKFLSELFLNMLEQRELNNSDRKDLLNVMIDFKNEYDLTENELVAQAAQFFLAGYETTSLVISFTLFELSLNKCIQDKLREEINENKDELGDVSYFNLKNMSYLDKVFSETLRKYPPVPFLGRTCMKDYKLPDSDILIEKGLAVMIPVIALHYDPKYFPNPQDFDPERFSEENVRGRNPFTYLPFGDGQRHCIGKRMAVLTVKLALFHIIKNFEVEINQKTKVPIQFSPKSFTLNSNPIYLTFKKLE